jgi:hypothetical protein
LTISPSFRATITPSSCVRAFYGITRFVTPLLVLVVLLRGLKIIYDPGKI